MYISISHKTVQLNQLDIIYFTLSVIDQTLSLITSTYVQSLEYGSNQSKIVEILPKEQNLSILNILKYIFKSIRLKMSLFQEI